MKYRLSELIDVSKNQKILDNYCNSIGIASAIIDLEGNVILSARWQRICTDFHRKNEITLKKCLESDINLANELQSGKKYTVYSCKNGLNDAASPIKIEGETVANVFIGQFLLAKPDLDFFKRYANECGFVEEDYIKALLEVPIISKEKLPSILDFLSSFAELVATMSIETIKQKEIGEQIWDLNEQLEEHVYERTKQLKKAVDEAEFANRAKSEFLANISHEIRTPMNAIMGYSEILDEKINDPEMREYTKSIILNGNSLLSIINDILDISRLETGNIEIHSEFIDMKNILINLKMKFFPKVAAKGLDFKLEISESFPDEIEIDGKRMMQVLSKLLDNALKFTCTGSIKISATNLNNTPENSLAEIAFIIEDTGIGMEQIRIEEIFNPFFQVDGKSNRRYSGLGLGLSLSARLVKQMGGSIAVESKPENGSKFAVIFKSIRVRSGLNEGNIPDSDNFVNKISFPEKEEIIMDLNKLSEFNAALNKYFREWEILNKSRQISAVKDFANKLIRSSKEFGSRELKNYSEELLTAANSLKVSKIKDLMNSFPGIIEVIKYKYSENS